MEEVFLGVMELQDAKNHQLNLKERGITLHLKSNKETCRTGCKVTVEVWGLKINLPQIQEYLKDDYFRHVQGHLPNFEHMSQVFDPNSAEVVCQACGAAFSPAQNECPDCGLVY
jgi:hypothetical protein